MTTFYTLHGFLGNGFDWDLLFEHLTDYNRVDLALAGHVPGQQDSPSDFKFDQQVARLANELNQSRISGGPRILLGYSMGARLALATAVSHSSEISELILISGTPGIESTPERASRQKLDQELAEFARASGAEAFIASWQERPTIQSQASMPAADYAAMLERRRALDPAAIANSLEFAGTGVMPNYWQHLPQLDLPVLLISGEQDKKFTEIADRMQSRLPKADHRIIADSGHSPQWEQPQQTAAVIEDWLSTQ